MAPARWLRVSFLIWIVAKLPLASPADAEIDIESHSALEVEDAGETHGCTCTPEGFANVQAKLEKIGKGSDSKCSRVAKEMTSMVCSVPKVEVRVETEAQADITEDRLVAAMTLGSVAFQMSLFYAVNNRDRDMKRYSYTIIGQTISIFCAVLVFNALFATIEEYLTMASALVQAVAYPGMFVFFWMLMQIIVKLAIGEDNNDVEDLHVPDNILSARTFGAFAAQLCGASSIQCFGHLQFVAYQSLRGHYKFGAVFGVVLLAYVVLLAIMGLSTHVRVIIIRATARSETDGVGWSQVAEDCENEVFTLSVGYLAAVASRVLMTETFPEVLLEGYHHSEELELTEYYNIMMLWGLGIVFGLVSFGLNVMMFAVYDESVSSKLLASPLHARSMQLFIHSLGMAFACCLIFGNHLFFVTLGALGDGIKLRLFIALFSSLVSYFVIKILDFIVDLEATGHACDKATVTVINFLGCGIGLIWECAFHSCVNTVVDSMCKSEIWLFSISDDSKIWALCLSIVVCIVVFPAYRLYIVPVMYALVEEYELETKQVEEELRNANPRASMITNLEMAIFTPTGEKAVQEHTFVFDNGDDPPLTADGYACATATSPAE